MQFTCSLIFPAKNRNCPVWDLQRHNQSLPQTHVRSLLKSYSFRPCSTMYNVPWSIFCHQQVRCQTMENAQLCRATARQSFPGFPFHVFCLQLFHTQHLAALGGQQSTRKAGFPGHSRQSWQGTATKSQHLDDQKSIAYWKGGRCNGERPWPVYKYSFWKPVSPLAVGKGKTLSRWDFFSSDPLLLIGFIKCCTVLDSLNWPQEPTSSSWLKKMCEEEGVAGRSCYRLTLIPISLCCSGWDEGSGVSNEGVKLNLKKWGIEWEGGLDFASYHPALVLVCCKWN